MPGRDFPRATHAPILASGSGVGGVERRLPGELEPGRRAGWSKGRGVGAEAEVLEHPAHDLAVRDESDELALPAATRGK